MIGGVHRWAKLRAALRGTRGYGVQQEAWDAVLPGWREYLKLVLEFGRAARSIKNDRLYEELVAGLNADNGRLRRPWGQLLSQAQYRRCPALGGWFPR